MINILLACNAGMSTSMLVTKMEKAAAASNIEANIKAVPVSAVGPTISKEAVNVLLTGPQVRYMVDEFKSKYEPEIKVSSIDMRDYGTMNGDKVLKYALSLLEN